MPTANIKDLSTKQQKEQDTTPWSKTVDTKRSENRPVHYTLIVRLPFPRGDFVDPPPVTWDAAKDRKLWKLISRTGAKLSNAAGASSASTSEGGTGSEVNWDAKAAEFGVDTRFLLQQAAWLYERHLEHVKKQVGRLRAGSTTSTPIPGQTSMIGKKPQPSSRAPSSLSIRSQNSPLPRVDTTVTNTSRPSTLSRTPSTATVTQSRQITVPPSPKSRPLRTPTERKQPTSTLRSTAVDDGSPGPASSSSSDESSDEEVAKMSRSRAAFRRPPRFGTKRETRTKLGNEGDDEDDESSDDDADEPTFFSVANLGGDGAGPDQVDRDLLADTLREHTSRQSRHALINRGASVEKAKATTKPTDSSLKQPRPTSTKPGPSQQSARPPSADRAPPTESSASSLSSSANATTSAPRSNAPIRRPTHPLSPRHRADLARLSSPRRGETSDGTPSMGSSFSDLDVDASVTQSALEEALASNLRNGGSRLSNISHAFRSRYM